MATEPQNLMDGLFSEMNRVREIVKEYEALPKGAGMFKRTISEAESVIKHNDVIEMLRQYQSLKGFEQ